MPNLAVAVVVREVVVGLELDPQAGVDRVPAVHEAEFASLVLRS